MAFLDPRSRRPASLPSESPSSRKVRPNERQLFNAARFASRIATICFACERVSSRRLARPARRPIFAKGVAAKSTKAALICQRRPRAIVTRVLIVRADGN